MMDMEPIARRVNLHEGAEHPPMWQLVERDKFFGNGFTHEALYSGEQVAALRSEVEELRAQNAAWRKQCDTLTHQVICCGVAASHPDATLTTRGAYAGKWNSAQAEEVRKLRSDRDRLRDGHMTHNAGNEG